MGMKPLGNEPRGLPIGDVVSKEDAYNGENTGIPGTVTKPKRTHGDPKVGDTVTEDGTPSIPPEGK